MYLPALSLSLSLSFISRFPFICPFITPFLLLPFYHSYYAQSLYICSDRLYILYIFYIISFSPSFTLVHSGTLVILLVCSPFRVAFSLSLFLLSLSLPSLSLPSVHRSHSRCRRLSHHPSRTLRIRISHWCNLSSRVHRHYGNNYRGISSIRLRVLLHISVGTVHSNSSLFINGTILVPYGSMGA